MIYRVWKIHLLLITLLDSPVSLISNNCKSLKVLRGVDKKTQKTQQNLVEKFLYQFLMKMELLDEIKFLWGVLVRVAL
jgi:hypothetical protein